MVAHLVRLKLALLRNSLRRSPWQLVGVIAGALYGLFLVAMLLVGLALLGRLDVELARTVLVLAGSAVIVGWALIPLVASGVDMTLDPARFVTYAVPMNQLLAGLALGGVIGIPGLVTLLVSLGQVATWWRHPGAAAASVLCAAVAVLTCVVISRLTTAATTTLASSRRFKDISGVIAIVPLILLGPIVAAVGTGVKQSQDFLPVLAATVSWTPLGSIWSVPADLAAGAPGAAGLKFLIAAAFLAVLLWLWKIMLARALVTPAHTAVSRKAGGNAGLFARFPATPTGAVAARSLTYWFRDPRYGASLIAVPLIPLMILFWGSQSGSLQALLLVGPVAAFLLAQAIAADVSYDNTAFWLHVSTGVSGAADRGGRALACAVFAVPVVLLFTVVPVAVLGQWALLPALLGVCLGILLTGLGLSSVVSARFTYNVPAPGDSPFKTPPGSGLRMMAVQLGGMLSLGLLTLPELGLGLLSFLTGEAHWGWAALAVGLLLGCALLLAGLRLGGRWYDRRAPELLLAVGRNR